MSASDEKPGPQDPDVPADTEAASDTATGRRRLPGRHASSAVIGVLTLILGFAIAVQVHANSSGDALSSLGEDNLIDILDNQNNRAERLRQQIGALQQNLNELQDSGDRSAAARAQATQERTTLGILLGTLPATGQGVVVTVTDPKSDLSGEQLLDVVEELRGAGAEAIQFGSVRVSTTTSFAGGDGSVDVDGTTLHAPYQVKAIGDSKTLDTALNIPGGVAASVRTLGGELTVAERAAVPITVTRSLPEPKYAKPSH